MHVPCVLRGPWQSMLAKFVLSNVAVGLLSCYRPAVILLHEPCVLAWGTMKAASFLGHVLVVNGSLRLLVALRGSSTHVKCA